MVTTLAKQAMTTKGQKVSLILDHLIEALGNDPSSTIRRALILADIDQYPGTTQVAIMERLRLDKSTVKREIDWLFDYGCIRIHDSAQDGRARPIEIYGYSKAEMKAALGYFGGAHDTLKKFLEGHAQFLKQDKPTLRDAKILATLYERGEAPKHEVLAGINSPASTNNRAYNKLVEDGVITDG